MIVLHHYRRQYELIGHLLVVRLLNRGKGRVRLQALTTRHSEIRHAGAIPAIVAVHRVVAPADRRDLRRGGAADLARARFQQAHELNTACRGRIASIGKGMDVDLLDVMHAGQLEQGLKVCLVRMYATVAKQTANMELGMVLLDVLDSFEERGILEKSTILNRLAHAGIIL